MYIIISTKGPKEMEELLNSNYKIEALGNTWLTNGTVYQSFLGEELSAIKKVPEKKPEVTEETVVTPKVTPKKAPVKRKKPKVTKEKPNV